MQLGPMARPSGLVLTCPSSRSIGHMPPSLFGFPFDSSPALPTAPVQLPSSSPSQLYCPLLAEMAGLAGRSRSRWGGPGGK